MTKLVKEIWELVLQSRFARNKQQLNVLLMGHSDWAENAKQSLASRSKEKPIVLNGTNTAEIELISKPTKKVSLTQPKSRLPLSSQPSSSPLKKGPVILFLILAFLTVFAGLLSWLYFDQISEIWLNKVTPITEIQQTQNEAKNNTAASAQSLTEIKSEAVPLQIAAQLSDTQKNMQIQEPLRGDAINVGSELLVADWHSANATNNIPKEVRNLIVIEDVKVTAPPLIQEANQVTIDKPAPPIQTDGEKQEALATVINDYPIAVNSVPSQTIDEKPEKLSQSTVHLDYSEQLLLGLPSNKYVIQIAAMSNFNLLQEYAFDNQLTQKVWLFKTQRYGAAWYVLLANESYTDLESARANIEQLPGTMREYVPFVKVLSQVQQEISVN